MTASRDPDRLIHAFLLEGEEQLHDQIYDAVRAEIEQKRQRALIGPWSASTMNKFVTFGLGAAAVVVIGLLIGSRLLGSPANLGGPSEATATPEPSVVLATDTPEPSPSDVGGLPEGPHVLWRKNLGVTINITVPAPGWYGEPAGGILSKNDNVDAPDGAGLIVFADTNDLLVGLGDVYVYGDPCHWESTKPDTPVTTVDEAMAALSGQASRDASAPVDVTLDGYAGKRITLNVPDDVVFSDCDGGEFHTLVEGEEDARYHQDPGQIDLLWILDVNGELVIFDMAYYEGTPESVLDEMAAIVESGTLDYSP